MPEMAFRPRFHFLPESNWINDPNGLIEWEGQYHLFYQANPEVPDFGRMVWGHAVSPDLVHWERRPVALRPDTPFDQDGCWTGCAIDHDGVPTLIYTGRVGETENVCQAVSPDGLKTFIKPENQRLDVFPPQGEKLAGFRDPYVWRENDGWYMVVGSGFGGKGGAALLYRSINLARWEFLGPLLASDSGQVGSMWECPNFFPLGDRHVLIVSDSSHGNAHYFSGRYIDHRLIVEHDGVVDQGGYFYAPQVLRDRRGRTILFGWVWEGLTKEARRSNGWAGMISLPRQLSLGLDGSLCSVPVVEVESLRAGETRLEGFTLAAGQDALLSVRGDSLELQAIFEVSDATCGVKLACSPGIQEETLVGYDPQARQVFIDREKSSLFAGARSGEPFAVLSTRQGERLDVGQGETLSLRIFYDRSIFEIFANDRLSLTSRIYPTLADAVGVRLFSSGGPAVVKTIRAWNLKPIW
jgi:beta-fructofuranosidase